MERLAPGADARSQLAAFKHHKADRRDGPQRLNSGHRDSLKRVRPRMTARAWRARRPALLLEVPNSTPLSAPTKRRQVFDWYTLTDPGEGTRDHEGLPQYAAMTRRVGMKSAISGHLIIALLAESYDHNGSATVNDTDASLVKGGR